MSCQKRDGALIPKREEKSHGQQDTCRAQYLPAVPVSEGNRRDAQTNASEDEQRVERALQKRYQLRKAQVELERYNLKHDIAVPDQSDDTPRDASHTTLPQHHQACQSYDAIATPNAPGPDVQRRHQGVGNGKDTPYPLRLRDIAKAEH